MTQIRGRIVSENPAPGIGDGRNLDPRRADERGEGAAIHVDRPEIAWPIKPDTPAHTEHAPSDTYYDLPVVKPAPWTSAISVYFHAGGLAGAASSLAGAVQLLGTRRHAALERRLHWISLAGESAGAVLLIADLGRPLRFFNMLRVFRPTSPMNLGTWILSASAAATGLSVLRGLVTRDRVPRPTVAGIGGALAGTLLSTYTAVLLGNTAIPIWKRTRRELPLWFASVSAASLASLLELIGSTAGERPLVRSYSIAAKAAVVASQVAVERAATAAGVDRPLRTGASGRMWRWSRWLAAGSLLATVWPAPRRQRLLIAGALGTASAVLSRFAITSAGHASAADPRATFEPQRRDPDLG